jgi:protein-tyrosine phosphatase
VIDLHNHILPAIDDGSPDLEHSLAMARIAVEDGIREIACTPHIYPGVYNNDADGIRQATEQLADVLKKEGIPLRLHFAADAHMASDMIDRLRAGTIPSFNSGRYFLLEFPHHVMVPNYRQFVFGLATAGYVPLITHPERLKWMDEQAYQDLRSMVKSGVWTQVTAGSLLGDFGKRARYWALRMLDEGLVHVLATDAHDANRRPPRMAEAVNVAAERVGKEEAARLVHDRPRAVLDNLAPAFVMPVPALADATVSERGSALDGLRTAFRRWSNRLR